jgi:hypothetical protein
LHLPMRPFGGLIFATDLIQFAKHDIAEMGRAAILRRTAASTRALALLLLLTAGLSGRGSGVRAARADDLLSSRPLPRFGRRSRPDVGGDGVIRSGASRSSSPAMPQNTSEGGDGPDSRSHRWGTLVHRGTDEDGAGGRVVARAGREICA